MASRLGVGRRSKHLETKSLFAQHLIKDGLVMLEAVHTKVDTADNVTKYLGTPTMRMLIGMLGVRLLTLDGAEAARCESTHHAQSGESVAILAQEPFLFKRARCFCRFTS